MGLNMAVQSIPKPGEKRSYQSLDDDIQKQEHCMICWDTRDAVVANMRREDCAAT
jgi:hypothetical protein